MAILGSLTKQPREVIDFDINYIATLEARGDTLSSTITEVSPIGLTVTSASIVESTIKVKVAAGTDGITYKVTILTTTTGGLVYEDEVNIIVEEV